MRILHLILRPSILFLTLMTVVSTAITPSSSQASDAIVIRFEAGQTVEIGTDTNSPDSQFSWILTKDRQFIGAQRTRFFQTRLADPGTYMLDVSFQDPVSGESGYRAFSLLVSPPTGTGMPSSQPATGSDSVGAVLRTDPAAINGTAYLPPEGGVLVLDPSQSQGTIASYSIDLDDGTDSNGDGNPRNDPDNQGTISQRQGTRLIVYMLPKASPRSVTLTTTDLTSGLTNSASVMIAFSAPPVVQQTSSIQSSGGPISMQANGLTVSFNAQLDPATTEGKSLLMEWDFGDRLKSLLDTPQHTYAVPGTYTVGLTVRDISTGTIVYSGTASLEVAMKADAASSASTTVEPTSSATSEPDSATGTSDSGGLPIGGILTVGFIIVVLIGCALALFFALQWLKGKTTASLQKTLEKMENSIVKKDSPGAMPETPEPMKLKKEAAKTIPEQLSKTVTPDTVSDKEKTKTEFTSRTRTNETPMASAGPVPAWLTNSGAKSPPTTQPPPAPAQPKMASAPAPNGNAPVAAPSWLTQTPAPPATSSAPKPSTAAAPVAKPTPAPSAPVNGSVATVTPPWLAKAQATPAVPTPPPQTSKPATPPAAAPVAPVAVKTPPPPAPTSKTPTPMPTSPAAPAPVPAPAPKTHSTVPAVPAAPPQEKPPPQTARTAQPPAPKPPSFAPLPPPSTEKTPTVTPTETPNVKPSPPVMPEKISQQEPSTKPEEKKHAPPTPSSKAASSPQSTPLAQIKTQTSPPPLNTQAQAPIPATLPDPVKEAAPAQTQPQTPVSPPTAQTPTPASLPDPVKEATPAQPPAPAANSDQRDPDAPIAIIQADSLNQ